jgi:DNA-binding transcriptional MerR regulator
MKLMIGQLSKLTGVPTKSIRYYEEVGILPPHQRSESRYRLYSETDVSRLELVRRARLLDMSLAEVRELAEGASGGTCDDFQGRFLEVVHRKLEEVDERIADLEHLKQDLQRLEAHFAEVGAGDGGVASEQATNTRLATAIAARALLI